MTKTKEYYAIAKEIYSKYNVNTDAVLQKISEIPISINCWQLDDIDGFEKKQIGLTGGISSTGNHQSKPKSLQEFKSFAKEVIEALPGKKKFNLHSIYIDCEESIERDEIEPKHFSSWVDFAKELGIGLDFNPTCFSHPMYKDGYTLSHKEPEIRRYWINHVKKSRKISEYFGKELGIRSVNNIWIPDGSKDETVDAYYHRQLLKESLDEIFAEKVNPKYCIDSVESKLFGIGSESHVVGSHDFYMNYVNNRENVIICMDMGHYHPTEKIGDKISALLTFQDEILLHISRPVRWDSDHVVLFDDDTKSVMKEIVRADALDRVHIALDFFDASIDRREALKIGAENVIKSLLYAMLEPVKILQDAERNNDLTTRLKILEEVKTLPFGFVWDYYKNINKA